MRASRAQAHRINITVRVGELGRRLLASASAWEASAPVERYANGVFADLGLADFAVPEITFDEQAPGVRPGEADVVINGKACRVPMIFPSNGASSTSRAAFIHRITRIIHLNRELLVDMELAKAYRESRASRRGGDCLRWLSRERLRDYLRLLARACQRFDRGSFADDPARLPIARWTAEECFEHAVAPLSCLRCTVLRPAGAAMTNAADDQRLDQLLDNTRDDLYRELGVRVPHIELREEPGLKQTEFRIQINDVRLPVVTRLAEMEYLASGEPDYLKQHGIETYPAGNPEMAVGAVLCRDDAQGAEQARSAGMSVWGRGGYLALVCKSELRKHAAAFITTEGIQYDLDLLKDFYGDVIARAKRRFGLPMIARVIRSLIAEGISIRDLAGVLEAMLAVKSTLDVHFERYIIFPPYTAAPCPAVFGKRVEDIGSDGYAECVRTHFKKYISLKHSAEGGTIQSLQIDPKIEDRIARATEDPLTEEDRNNILDAIHRTWSGIPLVGSVAPVIITNSEIRKPLSRLIEIEFPNLAVLSWPEADLPVQVIGHVAPA